MLIDVRIINEKIKELKLEECSFVNFCDVLEALSREENYREHLKLFEDRWVVSCPIDITESQGNVLLVNEINFTDIIFENFVQFYFRSLNISLKNVWFCSGVLIQGLSRDARLKLKHFDHVLSSTRTHIKNCIIEEFFVKPLVLDLKVAFEYCVFEVPIELSGRQFNHEITFLHCNITDVADFSDSQFYKDVLFCKTSFQDKVYFNNASFMQMLMIYENDFAKNLSFYQAKFANLPLMVSSDLDGNINLLDTRLLFNFKGMKEKIQEAKFKFFLPDIFKKVLSLNGEDIFAFRDSFRLFKNALVKEGNNLDASNYHRLELYCKELELDSKPQKTWRDWIDWFQLFFYRYTSDHHTDLLKILGWILMTIACFGVFLGMSRYGLDFGRFTEIYHLGFFSHIFSQVAMWFSTDLEYICAWFYGLFFLGLIFPLSRFVVSFGVVCLMIATQPKYILGIGGFIGGSVQAQNIGENFLFVIYSLLMFLLLFSLQKTARKNSIIPS